MTTPIPHDAALPQARAMLDPEVMTRVLADVLGRPVESVQVTYVRYRPGSRLLVRYSTRAGAETHEAVALADAHSDLASRVALPANAALAAKVGRRSPALRPLAFSEEITALIQWPPLDVALPILAETPDAVRDRLAAAGIAIAGENDLPRLIKYKPLSRAVFRLGGHVLKAHPHDASLDRSAHALRAVSRALPRRTAQLEAILPEWRLEVQSLVPGERPDSAAAAAPAAGAVLSELHAANLPELPASAPGDRLAETAEAARLVAAVVPRLAARAGRLLQRLGEAPPDEPLVASHGGFHISQLLIDENGEVGMIDLDGACLAPAAGDIASYGVSLVRGPDDLPRAVQALDALCEAYGRRPAGIPWYLSSLLLRRARLPFTRFREGWEDDVDTRLAGAEAALTL